jgi:hypothetical protein
MKDFSVLVAVLNIGAVVITGGIFELNLGTSFKHR